MWPKIGASIHLRRTTVITSLSIIHNGLIDYCGYVERGEELSAR